VVKKENKSGVFSKVKTESITHITLVKNTKKEVADVVVFDQLPFSQTDNIKVKLVEPSTSQPNVSVDEYSLISIRVKLDPGVEAKVKFVYEVQYPADKDVSFMKQEANPEGL